MKNFPEAFPLLTPELTTAWEKSAGAAEKLLLGTGVDLTQGGEPTFVPEDASAPEWTAEAMGPQKLDFARRMAGVLLREAYPGSFLIQTFGKQYPNEPLPRWNVLLIWRKDGRALWKSPTLLLKRDQKGSHPPEGLRSLARKLARVFIPGGQPIPAWELGSKPHLRHAAGYVLPLDHSEGSWTTADWPFNRQRPLRLIPGDSPIGLRLPLAEVPEGTLRRALTVQIRRGALEIFIPPLTLGAFVDLAARIEALARKEGWRDLVFTGYQPYDPDQDTLFLGLAADPGVLEANLPVCFTWSDYRAHLNNLYSAARASRLRPIKYRLNGQVRGTGGGAHVVFGGPTPLKSPFLCQPALFASILRFWQHHPSLSCAFAGQFIGPDSQHPRSDESARCKMADMEIACRGLESIKERDEKLFIQVDRMVRDLLIDRVGNTHRAEICVDKLWNPDAPNGSCGLLEFRAFESLPCAAHQALVGLFLRAIIAALARHPFTEPFRNRGSALHDAFLLPWYLRQDLLEIVRFLRKAEIPFSVEWLDPILDFRFPIQGVLPVSRTTRLVVRQAGELFPTLGERGSFRPVDVSTDRLELRLESDCPEAWQVTVNSVRIPLQTVEKNVAVAGVRFKKAQIFPGLAPHLEGQCPLDIRVFPVEKTGKAVGAHWFNWNPSGDAYPEQSITPALAAKRRADRWRLRRNLSIPKHIYEKVDLAASPSPLTTDLRLQASVNQYPGSIDGK